MQYLLTIYSQESDSPPPADVLDEIHAAYMAYNNELVAAGVMRGGNALQPTSTATSLTQRDGKSIITDGPFAETTEALGGFYLIECENLDDAIAWGKKCPGCVHGTVEVRPIMEIPGLD